MCLRPTHGDGRQVRRPCESGGPLSDQNTWIPIFVGMTYRSTKRSEASLKFLVGHSTNKNCAFMTPES